MLTVLHSPIQPTLGHVILKYLLLKKIRVPYAVQICAAQGAALLLLARNLFVVFVCVVILYLIFEYLEILIVIPKPMFI